MKSVLRRVSTIALLLTAMGCSSPSHEGKLTAGTFGQQDAAAQAFQHREQARYDSYLGQQLNEEARVLSLKSGSEDKRVQAKLALAQEYQRAAIEAARMGSELQRQVPHGMMQ